jgi:hypothetical protein
MTINRLNQGTTNQVLVKAISGQTTNLLELQDSSGNVVSSIGPTGALGGTIGNSGLVHINTQTFSAVAAVNFNNVFSATYDNYLIKFNNVTGSSTFWVTVRMRANGTDYTGAEHKRQKIGAGSTTVSGSRVTNNTAIEEVLFIESSVQNFGFLELSNPFVSGQITTAMQRGSDTSAGNINMNIHNYGINQTTSYDGFTAFVSGTFSGSISVYGYKK